jgi:hypothetical protein
MDDEVIPISIFKKYTFIFDGHIVNRMLYEENAEKERFGSPLLSVYLIIKFNHEYLGRL